MRGARARAIRSRAGNSACRWCARATHSLFSLMENPLIVFDEPEQIAAAAERLWKRLERSGPSVALPAGAEFFPLGRAARRMSRIRPRLQLRELDLAQPRSPALHIPTRPVHGLPRQHAGGGRRGAQSGGAGQSRRLLRAIDRRTGAAGRHFPGVLGAVPTRPRASGRHAAVSGRARLHGGRRRQHVTWSKGSVRRGVGLPRCAASRSSAPKICSTPPIWWRGPGPRKSQLARFHGRHRRSEAGRFRGPRHARRRQVSGHARDRARRQQGRLHAARIRGRRQAVRAAHAHGPGPEVPRRRRGRGAAARPPGRRHLGRAPSRASKPRCATWPTSC